MPFDSEVLIGDFTWFKLCIQARTKKSEYITLVTTGIGIGSTEIIFRSFHPKVTTRIGNLRLAIRSIN